MLLALFSNEILCLLSLGRILACSLLEGENVCYGVVSIVSTMGHAAGILLNSDMLVDCLRRSMDGRVSVVVKVRTTAR
jgi:hypothetical protein